MLQMLFFSVLFACGLAGSASGHSRCSTWSTRVSQALFWIIRLVMKIAPIAAFGAIAFTVAKFGVRSLVPLGALIGEFYLTCVLFFVLVLCADSRLRAASACSS